MKPPPVGAMNDEGPEALSRVALGGVGKSEGKSLGSAGGAPKPHAASTIASAAFRVPRQARVEAPSIPRTYF